MWIGLVHDSKIPVDIGAQDSEGLQLQQHNGQH
jgi:hypothetical protein